MKKTIILTAILFILVISSTLAFFVWNSKSNQDIDVALSLNGLDAYINYNKGTDVLTGTLLPSTDYTGGISTEIELWKSPSAEDRTIYGHIYLDITTIGTNLANEEALKWAITSNGKVLNIGNFVGQTKGSYVTLDINIPLSTTKQLFQIYIWLDKSIEINDQIEGETLSTKVRAEATEVIYPEVGAKYVSSLIYYDNEMINNDDPDGNIRYMGKNPDNYVLFNNELWRIIGVFDVKSSEDGPYEKRMKIIRNESIGTYSWDNKPAGSGSSISDRGSNDWTDSELMKVLNNGAYRNRTTGICPYGKNGKTKNCDFSKIGLTSESKSLIEDAYWNLSGYPNSFVSISTANNVYQYERGNNVYEGRPTFWIGKIGLMYPSDYGYATNGGTTTNRDDCLSKELSGWNELKYANCKDNDYLHNNNLNRWTLTQRSSESDENFIIYQTGFVNGHSGGVASAQGVFPTLYLKSSVQITGGSGTSTNPYLLADVNN